MSEHELTEEEAYTEEEWERRAPTPPELDDPDDGEHAHPETTPDEEG